MDECGAHIAWLLLTGRSTRTILFLPFWFLEKIYIFFYLDYLKMNNLFILGLELGFLSINSVNINLESNSWIRIPI